MQWQWQLISAFKHGSDNCVLLAWLCVSTASICPITVLAGRLVQVLHKSGMKPLVAPEEAACNLINCLQWCYSVARLHCGCNVVNTDTQKTFTAQQSYPSFLDLSPLNLYETIKSTLSNFISLLLLFQSYLFWSLGFDYTAALLWPQLNAMLPSAGDITLVKLVSALLTILAACRLSCDDFSRGRGVCCWSQIQLSPWARAGYTLDKLPAHHRALRSNLGFSM